MEWRRVRTINNNNSVLAHAVGDVGAGFSYTCQLFHCQLTPEVVSVFWEQLLLRFLSAGSTSQTAQTIKHGVKEFSCASSEAWEVGRVQNSRL